MPLKFFITHSHQDNVFARRLCDDLRANGLDGFFDVYSIKPGDIIPAEIQRGLETCDIYVPILSYAALASPWCDEEINAAITLSKMPGRKGRPRIIPILAEDCRDKMSVFLHNRLYVRFDVKYAEAFRDLLTRGFGVSIPPPVSQVALPLQPPIIVPSAPALPHTRTGKDGKEMILIPAGEFEMGEGKEAHKVYLDAFYVDRYPVTNAEYQKFVAATKHAIPEHWSNGRIPTGKENHPVVSVTWQDAVVYARWAGARLPTEAEWEKAASWDDAKKEKRGYPWSNEFDANKCNTSESRIGDTTPVGKYSPQGDSFYGVSDMAGNVWEWCADWYDETYYKNSPERNPQGPDSGQLRVLRGGSFLDVAYLVRCAFRGRGSPVDGGWYSGFRVVVSPV